MALKHAGKVVGWPFGIVAVAMEGQRFELISWVADPGRFRSTK